MSETPGIGTHRYRTQRCHPASVRSDPTRCENSFGTWFAVVKNCGQCGESFLHPYFREVMAFVGFTNQVLIGFVGAIRSAYLAALALRA